VENQQTQLTVGTVFILVQDEEANKEKREVEEERREEERAVLIALSGRPRWLRWRRGVSRVKREA
jgi:hypothetical protein